MLLKGLRMSAVARGWWVGMESTGDSGWVCYPQGMRDKSMGVTLVILNPVILPGFDPMWVLYVQGVPKKTVISGKLPITGLGRGLKIKVG